MNSTTTIRLSPFNSLPVVTFINNGRPVPVRVMIICENATVAQREVNLLHGMEHITDIECHDSAVKFDERVEPDFVHWTDDNAMRSPRPEEEGGPSFYDDPTISKGAKLLAAAAGYDPNESA